MCIHNLIAEVHTKFITHIVLSVLYSRLKTHKFFHFHHKLLVAIGVT